MARELRKMKKSKIVVLISIVFGIVTYFVNDLMVEKIAKEIVLSSEQIVSNLGDGFFDVQIIDSDVSGGKVSQNFAIYLMDGSERIPEPVYVNHDAMVSFLGVKVEGRITLPKDKGLAAEFIKNISSFNEEVNYTFSSYDKETVLISKLNVGVINVDKNTQVELGEIRFSLVGTSHVNNSTFILQSLDFKDGEEHFHLGEVTLNTILNPSLRSYELRLDEGRIAARNGGVNVSDVKLKNEMILGEQTSLSYDWSIGLFDLNSPKIILPSSKFGMSGSLDGINEEGLKELSLMMDESKYDDALIKYMLGSGVKFYDLNLYLNDSKMFGYVALNKSEKKALDNHQLKKEVKHSIESEFDVVLTHEMIYKLNVKPKVLEKFWIKSDDGSYNTKIKVLLGNIWVNGIKISEN